MGDRAMAKITSNDGTLFFYTHWCGHDLPSMAQEALDVAKTRQGDNSYALRRIVDVLIELSGARDTECGAGLLFSPMAEDSYNGDLPSITIDLEAWTVTGHGKHA